MATLLGMLMVVGGIVVIAVVRPWRADPDEDRPAPVAPAAPRSRPTPKAKRPRPSPSPGPGPGSPRPAQHTGPAKRHRVEVISRGRRVPPEPGREEILLPEWLGPVSGPR